MRSNNAFSSIFMTQDPYALRERETVSLSGQPDHRPAWRGVDVLAVSGNPTLAVYLSSLFRESGWKIACKPTCGESLAFLRDNRVAVAVCEQELPDGSWRNLATALARIPEAPALVVTGDNDSLEAEALAAGSFGVLVRPLKESDVLWTIASAWHGWMSRVETGGGRRTSHRKPYIRRLR
ncbi:MAG: response regulator [Bryobacterales bacterium]|nr:response regulator [Bryobacterales bacterium]